MKWILPIVVAFLLAGCGGYQLKNLGKSDVDLVADEFIAESRHLMRELTVKLYARNPNQLAKIPGMTVDLRLAQLNTSTDLNFAELGGRREVEALELVFDPNFSGDRVFALVVGLGGMIRHAYGYQEELFIFDSLDAEKLHTSARNVEILVWRLKNNRNQAGEHYLITSEYRGVVDNLSFERLFGKLYLLQEMMARIAGDADDRRVTMAVHAASSVFIPLPI